MAGRAFLFPTRILCGHSAGEPRGARIAFFLFGMRAFGPRARTPHFFPAPQKNEKSARAFDGEPFFENRPSMKTFASILFTVALATTTTFAQEDALTREDKEFLKNASELGMTEVELGKLAIKNGGSDDVKKLGKKLVSDHQKTNAELSKLAKKKNVELKMEPTVAQKKMISSFENKSGAEFDKEFREHAAKDHKDAIKTFEDAAKDAKDPDVKSFAEKNLSTLKEHHSALSR
jgi:putative membrane protein